MFEPVPGASETKDAILDTAERLFSEKGVDGVSLRALTAAAGVNIAAVHYHFGSKQEVARAVFARRIRPINQERLRLLDQCEAHGRPSIEELLAALYGPALQQARESGRGDHFMRLCARFYSEPAEFVEATFREEFSEVLARFLQAFQRALPELAAEEVGRRMHFAIGVLVHTLLNPARTWTDKPLPITADNDQDTLDAMVAFVAAGMRSDRYAREELPALVEVAQ